MKRMIDLFGEGKPVHIHLTGHSKGGAEATLYLAAALRGAGAVHTGIAYFSLYTFGSPAVGDKTFADAVIASIQALNVRHHRFVNGADVVPHVLTLLPPIQGYAHVGQSVVLTSVGKLIISVVPPLQDHILPAYVRALEAAQAKAEQSPPSAAGQWHSDARSTILIVSLPADSTVVSPRSVSLQQQAPVAHFVMNLPSARVTERLGMRVLDPVLPVPVKLTVHEGAKDDFVDLLRSLLVLF